MTSIGPYDRHMNGEDGNSVDGRGATDSHSEDKVDVGKACTSEESDAVSCIKCDHVGTVEVKRNTTPFEGKKTQLGSGLT